MHVGVQEQHMLPSAEHWWPQTITLLQQQHCATIKIISIITIKPATSPQTAISGPHSKTHPKRTPITKQNDISFPESMKYPSTPIHIKSMTERINTIREPLVPTTSLNPEEVIVVINTTPLIEIKIAPFASIIQKYKKYQQLKE